MSSLLDGIDVKDPNAAPRRSDPNPKVIKITVAGVLFLLAGVFFGMQAGLIPSPFADHRGRAMNAPYVTNGGQAEPSAVLEQLRQAEEDFVKTGGVIGDS